MNTALDMLFDAVRSYDGYPPDRKKICGEIAGTVFFPAGAGLFEPDTPLAEKPVMIVLDSFTPGLCFNRPRGLSGSSEVITRAWERILYFLIVAGIDPLDCFFTCAVPGIEIHLFPRPAISPAMVRHFNDHCQTLFRLSLRLQRPRLLLAVGLKTANLLSVFSPALHAWKHPATFHEMDRKENAIVRNIRIDNLPPFNAVVLTHPSDRGYHVEHRRYRRIRGFRAEVEMVTRAK